MYRTTKKLNRLYWGAYLLFVAALGAVLYAEDLGHGYHLESVEAPSHSSFEQVSYYDVLFFHELKIGRAGHCLIAPSGRFVIFESEGRLLLFDARSKSTRDVTDGDFAIPKNARWSHGSVTVTYYGLHASSTIKLPK